jgi:hypothetical protein
LLPNRRRPILPSSFDRKERAPRQPAESSDDQRLLLVKAVNDPDAPPPQIVVVQHFDEELKRLVPTR